MTQPIAPLAALSAGRSPRRAPHKRQGTPVAFALPALVWYAVFMVGPLVAVFYISLLDWKGILAPTTFAAFANYERMLGDSVFWSALGTTGLYLLGVVPVVVIAGFMVGYFLAQRPRGVELLRVVLFIPGLLSLAAQGAMFFAILSPNGLLNGILSGIGLEGLSRAWLADPSTALPSLIVLGWWGGIGITSILFAASLSGIDRSIYEAAELDGAGRWRRMWYIAFPISYSYIGVITMLQFLANLFGSAAIILILTKGGPGISTTTLSWLVYQKAFLQANVGYSQAIGVVLFIVGLIGIVAIRRVFRSKV